MPITDLQVNDGDMKRISNNLVSLGNTIGKKLVRGAMRVTLKDIVDDARELAPRGKGPLAGTLQKSIDQKITYKDSERLTIGMVGITRKKIQIGTVKTGKNKGKPIYKSPTRYGGLVEFGTSKAKAQPFLRPAWQAMGGQRALETFLDELDGGITAAVKGMKKK